MVSKVKTLLFNGCSFVAGDALVWERFCKGILKIDQVLNWEEFDSYRQYYLQFETGHTTVWERVCKDTLKLDRLIKWAEFDSYRLYYHQYRSGYNLAAQTAALCHTTSVDLSKDGASNAYIALTTIDYLMGLTTAEQKNIHVCIGWSGMERRLRWDNRTTAFVNLGVHSLRNSWSTEHRAFVTADIVNGSDLDNQMDFFKHVLLLESFLSAHNITYTFWRALGNLGNIDLISKTKFTKILNVDINDNWIKFDPHLSVVVGPSWCDSMTIDDCISKSNRHPNLKCVTAYANTLAKTISNL